MPFDLASAKRQARQTIHGLASVTASYLGPEDGAEPVDVTVRWSNKDAVPTGEIAHEGWPQIMVSVDKLIFSSTNLEAQGVTLKRAGTVTMPEGYNAVFELDFKLPGDGPENVYWTVTREG